MIFAIGVGMGFGLSLSDDEGKNNIFDEMLKTSPGNDDVSVGYTMEFGPFDTEQGKLTVEDYNHDVFDNEIIFPVCLDETFFEDWWVVIRSEGGYYPTLLYGDQSFDLYQKGLIVDDPENNMYIGYGLKWTNVDDIYKLEDECCSIHYYKFEVDTSCQNTGCLDSNQYPDVSGIPGMELDYYPYNPCGSTIPDKDVWIEIFSTWTGCPYHNQSFDLILAQKNHVLKIPDS